MPFLVLAIFAATVLWTLRDSWISDLAPPYELRTSDENRPDAASPARGDLRGLFSAGDYPTDALHNEEEGTVMTGLMIDASGRVSRCTVLASSGSESLDDATCRILSRRARFIPARDENGRAVASSYTQRITWRLQ